MNTDLDERIAELRAEGEPYAVATVVRTLAATAAKPGAKALLDAEGGYLAGFLGGGCVRGAVSRAARTAIAEGAPRLLSLQPQDLLTAAGVTPGEVRDGVEFARNGCPSEGTMDVFIEPVLPRPRLLICGAGPVALSLADLAGRFELHRTLAAIGTDLDAPPAVEAVVEGFEPGAHWQAARFVVVATQGKGDAVALAQAVQSGAPHVAFVGSRRKFAALAEKLAGQGIDRVALGRVHAPAGLDIHAITPDEIALSILAQIVAERRRVARAGSDGKDTSNAA